MLTETEFTFSLAGTPYLEFLPVVDLSSGRLLGMEALVRWQHPIEGVIPPGQLIPQAEASGDILSLTRWVLMEACRQADSWSPSIQLGVNCTIHQLRRGEVSTAVQDALERTGFPSGQLTLEVTEEAIVDSSASDDLKELSQMGVQLSVDDVGTNWSSFEPFKRHSISTVKIDGSFISGLESTQGINRLVVETVIHMAHSLGMSAIVEQVETMAQLEIVRSFQADAAQGFFFARPMSTDAATDLARSDEVPHFSRTSERTLLRRVDGVMVEEALGRDAGVGVTVSVDHLGDDVTAVEVAAIDAAGVTEQVDETADDVIRDTAGGAPDDLGVATDEPAGDGEASGGEPEEIVSDAGPDEGVDGVADPGAAGVADAGTDGGPDPGAAGVADAGTDDDHPEARPPGARLGRKRLKSRSSRSA
ncbi:MAG: EAL domain-containing protein [Acidimicrobiales bacterium]